MKVVFSRKGVDSAAGKISSALIDGRPVSLPIPDGPTSPTRYEQLAEPLASLSRDLSAGRLAGDQACHLDPDIDEAALPNRPRGWRGTLGQAGSALSHLRNQGVGEGDLFLFWGLYRNAKVVANRWCYAGPRRHCMFGWLKVGRILDVGNDGRRLLAEDPWLVSHPHAQAGRNGHDAIYVAADNFELAGRVFPGSGVFRKALVLSDKESRLPSHWRIPDWLNPAIGGTGLSCNPPERFEGSLLRSAPRGQEFVADIGDRPAAVQWIADTLERAT